MRSEEITIIFLVLLFVASFILSATALAYSVEDHKLTLTPNQITLVEILEENISISSNGCVVADCFTDQSIVALEHKTALLEEDLRMMINTDAKTSHLIELDIADKITVANETIINVNGLQVNTTKYHDGRIEASILTLAADVFIHDDSSLTVGSFTTAARLEIAQPRNGTIVYDSTLNLFYVYQNSDWVTLNGASSGVQSVIGTIGNITIGGSTTNRIVDLAVIGVPGTFEYPSLDIDQYGRVTSIISNPTPVQDVIGTTSQINSTGGINPIISLDSTLLSTIQSWSQLEPSGSPLNGQFLQYQDSLARLSWISIGIPSRAIFVDKSGNDTTGNGTASFPFLTVNKAITQAIANNPSTSNPTSVYVNAGVYIEVNPIVITNRNFNYWTINERYCFNAIKHNLGFFYNE